MQVLARAQRRNMAKLTPLIGAKAARLAVRGNQFAVAMLALLLFFALPTTLWYQHGGIGVLCGGSWLLSLVAGAVSWKLSNDGDRAASAFVSNKLGYGVTLRGGGTNTIRWRRRIDRAISGHVPTER